MQHHYIWRSSNLRKVFQDWLGSCPTPQNFTWSRVKMFSENKIQKWVLLWTNLSFAITEQYQICVNSLTTRSLIWTTTSQTNNMNPWPTLLSPNTDQTGIPPENCAINVCKAHWIGKKKLLKVGRTCMCLHEDTAQSGLMSYRVSGVQLVSLDVVDHSVCYQVLHW